METPITVRRGAGSRQSTETGRGRRRRALESDGRLVWL